MTVCFVLTHFFASCSVVIYFFVLGLVGVLTSSFSVILFYSERIRRSISLVDTDNLRGLFVFLVFYF